MLVKINNDTEEFLEEIEKLKSRFNVGTSSGAALQVILRFADLEQRYDLLKSKHEDLNAEVNELQDSLLAKSEAETIIHNFAMRNPVFID